MWKETSGPAAKLVDLVLLGCNSIARRFAISGHKNFVLISDRPCEFATYVSHHHGFIIRQKLLTALGPIDAICLLKIQFLSETCVVFMAREIR